MRALIALNGRTHSVESWLLEQMIAVSCCGISLVVLQEVCLNQMLLLLRLVKRQAKSEALWQSGIANMRLVILVGLLLAAHSVYLVVEDYGECHSRRLSDLHFILTVNINHVTCFSQKHLKRMNHVRIIKCASES